MIKVNNLKKSFGTNNQIEVLKDINLEFPKTGLIVLLGHSGSGKTTFLNVIGGLEKADSGHIEMFDRKVKIHKDHAWLKIRSKEVGYIFQNYHLIPTLTVYENVAISLRILGYKDEKEIEKRVFYTLDSINMLNYRNRLVTQLSGGQQQRVSIARAIVKNPNVILADEPTGNLDSKNTYEVMNIIKKISKEKLVIWVSHEKSLVKHFADRIIEIKDGEIINDFINDKQDFNYVDDNTIYLKELNIDTSIKNKKWDIEVYSDDNLEDEVDKPNQVKLILRNNTLYLDIEGSIRNIKIVNQDHSININKTQSLKEHQKTEIDKPFDLNVLAHDKDYKSKFSTFGKSFIKSFLNLFNLSKSAKAMLFIFSLMGILLAVGIPFIANSRSNRVIYQSDLKNLIRVNYIASSGANYRLLESIKEESDDEFYINVFGKSRVGFDLKTLSGESNLEFLVDLGIHDHLRSENLIAGTLPNSPYEIAIDYTIILDDYQLPISLFKQAGIWEIDMIIGKKIKNIYIPDRPFTITAVVNSGAKRIFAAKEAMVFIASNDNKNILSAEMFLNDENFTLTGNMPNPKRLDNAPYEILMPIDSLDLYPGLETHDFDSIDPFFVDFNVIATGYYEYSGNHKLDNIKLLPTQDLSFRLYQLTINQRVISITSSTPERTIIAVQTLFPSAQITYPYQEKMDEGRVFLIGLQSLLVLGLLLILLSTASVYFMLRASITSKVYEISIYRALGVKKIDLMKQYISEIIVIFTFSSLLSYILTTVIIQEVQDYLIGSANYFLVSIEGFIIGFFLIYLIASVGLIPIFKILRKPPANLLSQYDI
jgi:putative ABC transport system permease protein